MDICLARDRLLKLALEMEQNIGASVMQRDSLLIETVLKNAEIDIPEDAVFTGSFAHLDVMKEIVEARADALGEVLRQKDALKPHFAAQEIRAYTGVYDFGHTSPDWENVYRLGLPGLLERLKKAQPDATEAEEREYCAAGIRVWSAALEYVERMAKKAHVLGKSIWQADFWRFPKDLPRACLRQCSSAFCTMIFNRTWKEALCARWEDWIACSTLTGSVILKRESSQRRLRMP